MSNTLANERSPYLLAHAEQPVDWYPWSQDAVQLAIDEDKPILLSIGYSSCHWCHRIAKESFEDPDTAKIMNAHFINIKVDKEERPDLDHIYQLAYHLLNMQNGGWPLTLFLDPKNLAPFFGGTYFPNVSEHGLPPLKEVLKKANDYFHNHRGEVTRYTLQLRTALSKPLSHHEKHLYQISRDIIDEGCLQIANHFDPHFGGFSRDQKFPQVPTLNFIFDHWQTSMSLDNEDHTAKKVVELTLEKMAMGGIHDHVGGGFFRYSIDKQWQIPHFEKILSDNAQLMMIYAKASVAFERTDFADIALSIGDWAFREMLTKDGVFYTAIDADKDGEEGLYYLWDKENVQRCLDKDLYPIYEYTFSLDRKSNFYKRHHLFQPQDIASIAEHFSQSEKEIKRILKTANGKLLKERLKREKPFKDTKILTRSNALMLKALIEAGHQLNHQPFIDAANTLLHFIQTKLWHNHCLHASYYADHTMMPGYLDDYAFLLDAITTKLKYASDKSTMKFANHVAASMLEKFYDSLEGGFYYTEREIGPLLYRPKLLSDHDTPSGNAIAIKALHRLNQLNHNQHWDECINDTIEYALPFTEATLTAHPSFLSIINELLLRKTTMHHHS